MFLNLSQEHSIKKDDIVGIFDIDHAATSRDTRNFLRVREKEKKVKTFAKDIPKSFAVTKDDRVYLLRQSVVTIKSHL